MKGSWVAKKPALLKEHISNSFTIVNDASMKLQEAK